jgi:hypothetical protein
MIVAFVLGFMVASMSVSGCNEAATRTLTVYQFQSTNTYDGPFRVDISQLPSDAVESQTEAGGRGKPVTKLKLKHNYEVEVVLRLVETKADGNEAPRAEGLGAESQK